MREHSATTLRLERLLDDAMRHAFDPPGDGAGGDRVDAAIAAALRQRRNDANLLRRRAADHPDAATVLDRIAACTSRQLCGSAACPLCSTVFAEAMTPPIVALTYRHDAGWSCVTIIHTRTTIPVGRLARHRLFDDLEDALLDVLDYLRMPAIGTLEISCNEHHAGQHGARYVEHAHLLIRGIITPAIRRHLLATFPRGRGVKRPIKVQAYDGDPAAIHYMLKPQTTRRIQISATRPDGSRSIFSTRKKPLRSAQRVEVAIAMNRFAPTRRLIMHGIDVVETRKELRPRVRDDDA